MIICNKLRGFGQLPQSPVVAAKERALFRKRCSLGATAVAEAAAAAEAAEAAVDAVLASESEDDSGDDSDDDSDENDKPNAHTYVFPPSSVDSDDDA